MVKAIIRSIADITINAATIGFTVEVDKCYRQDLMDAVNAVYDGKKPFVITIEPQKRQRSLNANNYCWVLCQKIAEKVGTTKEVVYQKNIREVGSFDVVEVAEQAAERFIARWHSNGIGWLAEPVGEPRGGYINIMAYYGSSQYDTAEMARLIDAIVQEAKGLQIETMTPDELERLKTAWKGTNEHD